MAAYLVQQVDERGRARFVGHTLDSRREMLKVARLLPREVVSEIFPDPRHPTRTFMEIYLAPSMVDFEPSFRLVHPDSATG